jgi:hypothetical protein
MRRRRAGTFRRISRQAYLITSLSVPTPQATLPLVTRMFLLGLLSCSQTSKKLTRAPFLPLDISAAISTAQLSGERPAICSGHCKQELAARPLQRTLYRSRVVLQSTGSTEERKRENEERRRYETAASRPDKNGRLALQVKALRIECPAPWRGRGRRELLRHARVYGARTPFHTNREQNPDSGARRSRKPPRIHSFDQGASEHPPC